MVTSEDMILMPAGADEAFSSANCGLTRDKNGNISGGGKYLELVLDTLFQ